MRARFSLALGALAAIVWAVPVFGAAHFYAPRTPAQTLQPIRFRVNRDQGLLVNAWLNGRGPYIFAVDTGAGLSLVSDRLVTLAGLKVRSTPHTLIGGLSGVTTASNRQAVIATLALGFQNNLLPPGKTAVIIGNLPEGVDGILDPTDAFAPDGYSIDLPQGLIEVLSDGAAFDRDASGEGATVQWLRQGDSDRPFVKLGDGRIALIDTGSRFGLAISDRQAIVVSDKQRRRRMPGLDLGGGAVNSRRVQPTTISIGELVLRRIPTDILSHTSEDAPVILGRDALYPFKISFDPSRRLIAFAASSDNK